MLRAERGSVVAPAGCGKTQLIVRAAATPARKRTLILTHTNAGVRALKDRMRRLRVSSQYVHVDTIAGWALDYARSYPVTSQTGTAEPEGAAWKTVYRGVSQLLDVRAIRSVVQASYARVLVDEYQDCSPDQHALVGELARHLPTCVLGDPLQGIFDLGEGLVAWHQVTADFPLLGELSEPWRWKSKNRQLGEWCLELREALKRGDPIDLQRAPIRWRQLEGISQREEAFRLMRSAGGVVVIRKWEAQAHEFARSLGGAYRSHEEVEGKALRAFAAEMDALEGPERAAAVVELAAACMTGVKAEIPSIAKALAQGKKPTLKQSRKHPHVAMALIDVCNDRSAARALAALVELEKLPDCRRFRSELWSAAKRMLAEHPVSGRALLCETAAALRQRHRAAGRFVDPRLVSRTLLIKGLEFDHALVPNAGEFESAHTRDGARHFYVAATRASISLSVLSASAVVQFNAPAL